MCRDAACSVRFFTTEFTEFHGVFIFHFVIQNIVEDEVKNLECIHVYASTSASRDPSLHFVPFWMTRRGVAQADNGGRVLMNNY